MKCYVFILVCFSFQIHFVEAQQSRIESEFKLAIPDSLVEELHQFLIESFTDSIVFENNTLFIERSSEIFKDTYFDTKSMTLLDQQIGLRHRLRYLGKELINEVVQLKFPDSKDGIQRREIKFEVPKKLNLLDEFSRDPFLQFLNPIDRDKLAFQLRKYDASIHELKETVSLSQRRERIYFSDHEGSVATITLDKVKYTSFPFQSFTELEIEINEIRYTNANSISKQYFNKISEQLKSRLTSNFVSLELDQRPKYNKMMALIQENIFSKLSANIMWFVYVIIIVMACLKFSVA